VNQAVVTQELTLKRAASKRYYDSSPTKVHPELAVGSSVYAKPPPTQRGQPWIQGTIISQDTPRSYTIQTPNSNIRRNRVHITPTVKQSPLPTQTTPPPPLIQEPPPDNANLSIGPQVKDTVANDHRPAQALLRMMAGGHAKTGSVSVALKLYLLALFVGSLYHFESNKT